MSSEDWPRITFGDLIAQGVLRIGDGYRAKNNELGGDGPIFLRAGHVRDTHIEFEAADHFAGELTPKLEAKMSRAGDVVITTKGNSTGRVTFVSDDMPPFIYSPHLSFWRSLDPNALHPGFLRYWSRSREFRTQLAGFAAQTDMAPFISLRDQQRLQITVPPPSIQQTIAGTLGALDDKIELNRRMNRTLESIARAIFKSWFVDFDPVRKKMEGGEVGLPPDLAALLPDTLVDSIIGPIPEGWPVVPLSELVEVNPKYALPRGAETPYVEMAGLPTDAVRVVDWRSRPFTSGSRFRNGDVLMARITPCLENGKTALVDMLKTGDTGWGSTEFLVLRSLPPASPEYVYCLARSTGLRDHAVGSMNGSSGRQRVPVEAISKFLTLRPNEGILDAFARLAASTVRQMASNDEGARSLIELRDSLLSHLLGHPGSLQE